MKQQTTYPGSSSASSPWAVVIMRGSLAEKSIRSVCFLGYSSGRDSSEVSIPSVKVLLYGILRADLLKRLKHACKVSDPQ